MVFADRELAKRLERAEGDACREFAQARARLYPESGAAWMECAGAYAVFDGADSPVTQTFGLGLFEDATPGALDTMEEFFLSRGAPVVHEVSPLAGVPTLALLCERGYRPVELSSVLYKTVEASSVHSSEGVTVRMAVADEAEVWAEVSARGWSYEYPELGEMMKQFGTLGFARASSVNFLAELDGIPGAAGTLCLHDGVALFGGAATVPEMRRRGLQRALLEERMRYADSHDYLLAMMVAEAGSQSQRNAERVGFRVAYTRVKFKYSA